jgi:predicted TIM-barrel enzyme
MDVITTSGPGTGKPPTVEKIKEIRSYIGAKPMAIASGINSENKKLFENLVDYYLVASSLIDNSERFVESKLKEILK